MSIASSVSINIGGEDRLLKFTHAAATRLERVLPKQNLYLTILDGVIPFSADAHALMFALEGGGTKGLTLDLVQKWRDKFVEEHDAFTLNAKLVEALYFSGIFGRKTKFQELSAGGTVEAEVVDEEKNEQQATTGGGRKKT